jgi:hypothetical protein
MPHPQTRNINEKLSFAGRPSKIPQLKCPKTIHGRSSPRCTMQDELPDTEFLDLRLSSEGKYEERKKEGARERNPFMQTQADRAHVSMPWCRIVAL